MPTSPQPQRSDREVESLAAAVRDGDQAAFGKLVAMHERAVRAFVHGRCPPWVDADDIAQRIFLCAWREIGRYQPGTDFAAWLFSIARYQVLAELTRLRREEERRARTMPDLLLMEIERRAEERPSDEVERLAALRECLQTLRNGPRELLRLRYGQNLGLRELAEHSRRSTGAL